MEFKLTKPIAVLAVAASILSIANPVFAGEKLKVFILAGQSNMVGHANPHTIATLYKSTDARDGELARLVFKEGSAASKKALDEQLIRAIQLDELTGGISNDKLKKMSDGPEKTSLEARVKELKDACSLNGQRSFVKANQGRGLKYPDMWMNVPPGAVILLGKHFS